MSSRKRGRKPQQQRLTFEPIAAGASASSSSPMRPGLGLSPARVRFSSPSRTQEASPSRTIPVRSSPLKTRRKGTARQQTLEAATGKEKVRQNSRKPSAKRDDDDLLPLSIGDEDQMRRRTAPSPPQSSFMKVKRGRRVVADDSDSETPVEEDGGVTDSDGEGPLTQETPRRARPQQVVSISSGSDNETEEELDNTRSSQSLPNQAAATDDSDDQPLATPRSSMPRRKGRQAVDADNDDNDNEEDQDDEDEDIQTPAKRRRLAKNRPVPVSQDSSSEESGTLRARSRSMAASNMRGSSPPASTARSMRSTARKGHRSEKDKKLELLRRRRAGEKDLTMEDLTSSEDDEDGGLYDTDSDHQVLEVFDDESEAEVEAPTNKSKKKAKKGLPARRSSPLDEYAESEDDDFIDDDDDTLGVPDEALHLIPLEFTRASRKPLKAHFRDAVEWLVHRKINPGFDKDNEVYINAWRRLSDEVTGLANSKFVSSVWRPDFYRALKARPYIEPLELGAGHLAVELQNCQACGRSGHPASWGITFTGKPYDGRTLDEVESDSEDSEDSEDGDRDVDGNPIPPEDRQFFVGATCCSNAETAHSLIHWKLALRDWVDARLEGEGLMSADKIVKREKMKAKKRRKQADEIVERWDEEAVIKNLFLDFKSTIESARNKDTSKVARGRGRYLA